MKKVESNKHKSIISMNNFNYQDTNPSLKFNPV